MSQLKVWTISDSTTVRKNRSNGNTAGMGGGNHLYVGRDKDYDYDSYVKPTLDWSGVGKIVKCELVVYTDDGSGDVPFSSSRHPHVVVRRLTSAFTEGNAPDGTWQANDYTSASYTTSAQRSVDVSRAANAVNRIDITDIADAWAPSTVKAHDSGVGGKAANFGLSINGTTDTDQLWAGWSRHASVGVRVTIELTYEYGPTVPNTPTNLVPAGAVAALVSFQGDFSDIRATDVLAYSQVQVFTNAADKTGTAGTNDVVTVNGHGLTNGSIVWFTSLTGGTGLATNRPYFARNVSTNAFKVSTTKGGTPVDITGAYSALSIATPIYDVTLACSNTERVAGRFTHIPKDLTLKKGVTYQWRARVTDQEGQVSSFTARQAFSVNDTPPNAPTISPVGQTYATLDGVSFSGNFTDPDGGDRLLAYQVQLSPYGVGDSRWDQADGPLWDTGKVFVGAGSTTWATPYGGAPLAAGAYFWRARVFDQSEAVSAWTYAAITLSADFVEDPSQAPTSIQLRPVAPWRIVIKAMGTNRGPGKVVAILEDAKSVGASQVYNSPGEAHWTVQVDHPQISAIQPKQTHYSIQFRQGDGWREVFAGLVWDADANERDVVFYGLDYLALFDMVLDERYDPSNPNKPAEKGGSYYVTSGKNSIQYIVTDQLTRAVSKQPNSPVRFITVGPIAAMNETVSVYSTYRPVLTFVSSLLDSHRAGTGKRTRVMVRPKVGGGYEVVVLDAPGVTRSNLRLRYGELVQGYRVVLFGKNWASRIAGIGRTREGLRVMYKTRAAAGIDESVWGRFVQATVVDGVSDENDLSRRVQQMATRAGKLGKQMGLGIRSGVLLPLDGYSVTDVFPVDIVHGAINTNALGSGLWACMAVTWEGGDQGQSNTILTLWPNEDAVAPDTNLIQLSPISPQQEWQVGSTPPNPLKVTAKNYLDQTTGTAYTRSVTGTSRTGITGTP